MITSTTCMQVALQQMHLQLSGYPKKIDAGFANKGETVFNTVKIVFEGKIIFDTNKLLLLTK